ncbi:hypothetical protein QJQ45_009408 [Haematococcus lacustris]|nr:hypothetical protein QJQ45_009408 [Haematococcus lacustris]
MLKDGHKHFAGLDEAVMRNIEACKNLAQITRTSLGPNGMNKMVINHLERLFVTSDASTIVSEMEVNHPAARLLVLAAMAQEQEIGDGTNLVLTFGGELLSNAEALLRDGLVTAEIADGYSRAGAKALEILETLVVEGSKEAVDVRDKDLVARRLKGAIASKISGYEDMLAQLVAEACIDVLPKNPVNFNVDNVRVVVKGMVLRRDAEGTVKHMENAKVAVYSQGIDTSSTDTKGTVLIKTAAELENYAKSEESKLEEYIKAIADTGVKAGATAKAHVASSSSSSISESRLQGLLRGVVASGSAIGEMAMHFLEKYGLMVLRVPSKFELLRFCKSTGATARASFGAPSPDELGFVKYLSVQEASLGAISTIVLRGSTEGFLDDVERALNDGVNAFKALTRDGRCVAAGGATELELARQIGDWGKKLTGLEQYAVKAFAESFEVVPRTLAENSGLNATDVLSALYAAHAQGQINTGVDINGGPPKDLSQEGVVDLYATKWWALKLATDAAATVLRVDQIIMAKQAGGPKPRGMGGDDD